MSLAENLEKLRRADGVTVTQQEPVTDVDAFAAVVKPDFGELSWTPPASYGEALRLGPFGAQREDRAIGMSCGFTLLGPDDLASVNADLVHIPEGVSIDDGIFLSTNHLVGFAEAGGEAVWCFDVTAGENGDYPVYYHHQDDPRARVVETGKWAEPDDAKPDFASFDAWLAEMTTALTAREADLPPWFQRLGEPSLRFSPL